MGILSYFTRHRTAANLLLVLLIALGLSAVPRMRAQFFPDVVIDTVRVTVVWDGAGAEDVDRAIVQLIEPTLIDIEGVTETFASSQEGAAYISVEFEPGTDMAAAEEDVQAAVDAINDLPDAAEDPVVAQSAWRDRVTDVVITGPLGVDQLARFTDEFVLRLREAGVSRTTIRGIASPSTMVEVPSLALIEHNLSLAEIATAIAAETDTNPAGDVSGSTRLRTGRERRSADDLAGIALRSNTDGSKLTLGQVATITEQGVDRDRAYFVGDNPAISVRVDRSQSGDAIKVQKTVEEVAAELETTLPDGVKITLIRQRAEAITARLNLLMDNGLIGLGLVVGLLFLFLSARTAFWVAAGIPVAMLTAIALMYAAGLTINMVSLFALIITLGIVVDDAIVVGEHADARARRLGESPVEAAENAAKRMFTPVFSATITTVIAFFGLVAIGGRFGDLIKDIPFTVIVVLIASLIECFLILPNHMSHAVGAKERWYDWPSRQVNRGFTWFRNRIFRPFIALVMQARYPVLAGAILLLASQVALVIKGDVGWRFFVGPERSTISGNFAMLPGATREDTTAMMRELQRATTTLATRYEEEYGTNPVILAIAEVGGTTGRGLSGADSKDADQLGSIAIELIDSDLRPYATSTFTSDLQDEVRKHPLAETVAFRGSRSGPGGDSIDVDLFGADPETLKAAAEELKATLARYPEVTALEDSLAYDKEELILELTPQGEALGFTIEALGRVLRNRLGGIEAASFPVGLRSATIRVELPPEELTADFLSRTQMQTPTGVWVPLSDIVRTQSRTGFSTINRVNGTMLMSVTGDLSEEDNERAAEITEEMASQILPDLEAQFGISTSLSGLAEQEQEFMNDARTGLILVLLGIYLTLSWIFSSWTRPLVVMFIIPFGLVGAIFGHWLWGIPLSMFSVVGLIGMVGIIINDSIVLVTTIDEHAETRGMRPAIIDGTADRLRAVFLTTITTVLGLAPLLYEGSSQAQFLKPTVITLTYGLGFGMVLVLIIVPALIAAQQDFARLFQSLRRGWRAPAAGIRRPVQAAVLGMAALFAMLFGPVLLGQPPLLPLASGYAMSFAAFVGALALWLVAVFTVTAMAAKR